MSWITKAVVPVIMCSCFCGCSTYRTAGLPRVPVGYERDLLVEEGDKVRLVLVDGSVDEGWILELTPVQLVLVDQAVRPGETGGKLSRSIRVEEIHSAKVKKTHAGKTVGLTLGILSAGFIAFVAATFESVNFGGG